MRCQRHGTGKEGEELVNTGTEGNLEVASVTPLTANVNSFDKQVRYSAYLLTHISTEKGRIRINCIQQDNLKKGKDSKRDYIKLQIIFYVHKIKLRLNPKI